MAEASEFERLVLEQLDSFWGYALGLTGREDRAEDVLQDALTRGFERFALFDRSLSFKAWMFTIIRHIHVDHLRKGDARRQNGSSELLEEAIPSASDSPLYAIPLDPEALLVHRESVERLQDAIQQLPADFPVVELWRVLAGQEPGRTGDAQVTVFDSVGFALEDFSALRYVYRKACEMGIGTETDLIPPTDDPKDLFRHTRRGSGARSLLRRVA